MGYRRGEEQTGVVEGCKGGETACVVETVFHITSFTYEHD